jgi:hypothetical protein
LSIIPICAIIGATMIGFLALNLSPSLKRVKV